MRLYIHVKKFANAGVFFPAANVCNFSQGANPVATAIAVGNLIYSLLRICLPVTGKNRPKASWLKKWPLLSSIANFQNPLRVTSICTLTVSVILLSAYMRGSPTALFPGLAAFFFGIGNFFASAKFRDNRKIGHAIETVTHPAIWYGLGYTMTGIAIGGGLFLLARPLDDKTAALLIAVGIAETAGSLALMAFGKVTNRAAPFVGVAVGTLVFAITGLTTGNIAGAATGLFACAGELSLAIQEQQNYNARNGSVSSANSNSKIEIFLTAPIRMAMKRGWIATTPVK